MVAPLYTAQQLADAGRDVVAPLRVVTSTNNTEREFLVEAILRLLPGRRLVAQAREGDAEPVLLKLFYGDGAAEYCARELRGYEALSNARMPTPPLLDAGPTALCYQWLAAAQPIDENDREQVKDVIELVGKMHRANLLQTDMHLDNFIRAGDQLYALDPDGVRSNPPLTEDPARYRDNLAVLFAQLPPTEDQHLPGRLLRYLHGANIATDSALAARLAAQVPTAVDSARTARVRRYLDKTLRDCTEFHVERSASQRFVAKRTALAPQLLAFAEDPEALLAGAVIIKAGNTATVMRVVIDGVSRVVKRYNIKSLGHRLRQSLRPQSRAERSWRNGHRLDFLRIPTAQPIALLERRRNGLRDVAYLVTEDLGALDLAAELSEHPLTERRLAQIAQLFEALELARLSHGDTKATNWLVHDDRVFLIDLDSMRPSRRGLDQDRDRERFIANWPQQSEVGATMRALLNP